MGYTINDTIPDKRAPCDDRTGLYATNKWDFQVKREIDIVTSTYIYHLRGHIEIYESKAVYDAGNAPVWWMEYHDIVIPAESANGSLAVLFYEGTKAGYDSVTDDLQLPA